MNVVLYVMINVGLAYRYLPTPKDSFDKKMVQQHMSGAKVVPHHALVVYSNLYCSGSLITSKVVVTAASCLLDYSTSQSVVVKLGSDTVTGFGQIIAVREVKIHEYFRHLSSLDNDIAMLVLKSEANFNEQVALVNIIDPEMALHEGTPLHVAGWGGSDLPVKYANTILLSEVAVIDKYECQKIHGSLITNSNFCAKYNQKQRLSDNGGGALYYDVLVGVLSYGATESKESTVIFTNVSYFHRWLQLNTVELVHGHYYRNNSTASSLEGNQ